MSAVQAIEWNKFSVREKLAQLIFVRIGSNLPPVRTVEEDAERVEGLLREHPLGGLLLFNGQRDRTAQTLQRLQSLAKYPLLIGADIERGIGQQLRGYTLFPHAMAFDPLGDEREKQAFEFARLTAIGARAHGIHMSFSPVADVNADPRNPIIATRAFSNDPAKVAELVSAFIAGSEAGGILAAAKHFPGHGNTHEDSHHALPTVHGTRDDLSSCELVPFQAAIAAGAPLIMTAHVRFPAWDEENPATLSKPILCDLLRDELKFSGAVVSDSLLMEGVKSRFADEGEMVLHSPKAGVDLQLDVSDPGAVLDTLERAIADGRLSLERVGEAFARVVNLKKRVFGLIEIPSANELSKIIEQSEYLAKSVARKSIQTIASPKRLTPFDVGKKLLVVMLRPHQSHLDPPEQPLGEFLHGHSRNCEYVELRPDSTSEDYANVQRRALDADQLVISMIVKPAAWYRFGLLPEQDKLVCELTSKRDCVVACLGSPVALETYDNASERICTFSDVFVSQEALAAFLYDRDTLTTA